MAYPQYKNKHLQEALFSPDDFIADMNKRRRLLGKFPKKYLIVYDTSSFKHFRRKYRPKEIRFHGNARLFAYRNMCLVKMGGIGSPHASAVVEELIACGGKEFLNIGTAGGLHREGVFLCKKALRDEGTSHHYLPHGKFTYPDEKLTEMLGKSIDKKGLEYVEGTTWTIDAPYRETLAEVEHYSKKGISTVEMEASALFAVAKYRKAKIASAFVVSDVLSVKDGWRPKFHAFNLKKTLALLVDAAVDCLNH